VRSKFKNDASSSEKLEKITLKVIQGHQIFFHHILAIDVFQISQDKKNSGKRVISPICVFFGIFWALFDTFSTIYNDSDIKFKFSGYFFSYKSFS
jgi:hypothetical protein